MRTKTVGAVLLVVALAAGGSWLFLRSAAQPAPQSTFVLLDASTRTTQDLHGKVTLVNFWATSCTTCVKEMPEIVATHEKYRARGFDTLAVAMSYDPPAYVAAFAESRKLPFAVAIDNTGEIAQRFGDIRLTPTTLLINKRGEIVKRYIGEPDFKALHALVEQLLAEA